MQQGEKLAISKLKTEALTEYCKFCIRKEEVPRSEQIVLINGCNNIEALTEAIKIYKTNL